VQLVHRRQRTGAALETSALLRRQIALAQIARRTGGDHVFPGGLAALAARDDVVERVRSSWARQLLAEQNGRAGTTLNRVKADACSA